MRIFGITIPDEKQLSIGLTALYGIGRSRAQKMLADAKIDPSTKGKDLTEDQERDLRTTIETYKLEGDLKREVSANVKRLKDIKSYRGNRHSRHLPTRGQNTKRNSRTVRGNTRNTMGSGRRKVEKK